MDKFRARLYGVIEQNVAPDAFERSLFRERLGAPVNVGVELSRYAAGVSLLSLCTVLPP